MSAKLLKVTFHGGPKKQSAYLRNPSQVLAYLYREIELRFQNKPLPQWETIRTFWIDADGDEIEIIDQNDYETFREKCESTKTDMHLQLAPAGSEPTVTQKQEKTSQEGKASTSAAANEADASNFIIHDNVECDGCGLAPLVGFRYKCVQCPNFDLCQRCEAAHKHPEHLMVRMPTNNGPSVVDAWLTGPEHGSCHRRFKGRSRGHCPFAEAATAAAAAAAPQTATGQSSSHKESREGRRERKHARRHGGVLSQFMEMMVNMPESNATATAAAAATGTTPPAATKPSSTKPSAPTVEPTVEAKTTEKVTTTVPPTQEETTPTAATAQSASKATEPSKEATAEPVAAPRAKESAQANPTASTPTTPVINLENLSQIVPPEYMRAGIEILNNFSEMFAKMLDPADVGVELGRRNSTVSMTSGTSAASTNTDSDTTPLLNNKPEKSKEASLEQTIKAPVVESQPLLAEPVSVVEPESTDEQRRRSESLDQLDWQLVDGNVSTASPEPEALINLEASTAEAPKAATSPEVQLAAGPVPNFSQLGELLRQHVNEEQLREQATAHTQTAQVDTVSTSTSTTSTNGNATVTPAKPEEKRSLPIYHTDEKINSAIHAMMAMGFSNEGAWLTQLLESVDGNIAVALDIMHTSQSNRQ